MEPIIEVAHISKTYAGSDSQNIVVFDDFSIQFFDKDITAVLGPSGSGKTTLLSMINGLLTQDSGLISFPRSSSLKIGTVLQKDLLLPWRNVRQNAVLGLEIAGAPISDTNIRAKLSEFGLDTFQDLYPNQLSGGMRQKVSLIRTLLFEPELILLDEPFANIDYYRKLELESYCAKWIRDKKRTGILVTHDIEEAIAVADRVVVIRGVPAKIALDIRIELTKRSQPDPILARKQPKFADYFEQIWMALRANEE
jgi:NitT/TauT family transport system ATP-binding protein